MNKFKIVIYLLLSCLSTIATTGVMFFMVHTDPSILPFSIKLLVFVLFLGTFISTITFLFLFLFELFKKFERKKLFFRLFLFFLLLTLILLGLLFHRNWGAILIISVPITLISFAGWIISSFFKNDLSIRQRIFSLLSGLGITLIAGLLAIIVIVSYIIRNPEKYGFTSWAYDLSSIPESLRYWYLYKTGTKEKPDLLLRPNTPAKAHDLYLAPINVESKKSLSMSISNFSSGKIAFIKNNNLWIAGKNGVAFQITNDANKRSQGLFQAIPVYRYPVWSPQGDKLAFIQTTSLGDSGSGISRYLITDGDKILGDEFQDYGDLPPYWINNEEVLIPSLPNFWPKTVTRKNGTLDFDPNRSKSALYFDNGYNIADGCGGGGSPEWLYQLSYNHLGGLGSLRASLFYLDSTNKVVYSTDCAEATSLQKGPNSPVSEWFDPNKKPYNIVKSLQKISSESIPGFFRFIPSSFDFYDGPHELLLSLDKKWIVGTENRNIVLYDSKANFIKTLWKSGKAYGPVFSQDSKFIYFADNLYGKPSLVRIDLDGGNPKTILTSDKVGAISNISSSPDGNQLVFTLIQETFPQGSKKDEEWYSEAVEDIYLVKNDGTRLIKFVENASQSAWSPK